MTAQDRGYYNLAANIAGYAAQEKYCEENKLPMFIDGSCSCYKCGRHVFDTGGCTVEEAEKKLITGCPFCNASFCD